MKHYISIILLKIQLGLYIIIPEPSENVIIHALLRGNNFKLDTNHFIRMCTHKQR